MDNGESARRRTRQAADQPSAGRTTSRSTASSTRWSMRPAIRARSGSSSSQRSRSWAPEELPQRFARADQYLRDAGVYYRVYDKAGANEREWPLAHVPLLIDESGVGRHQRRPDAARRSVRGDRRRHLRRRTRLVEEGLLPPGLIAASPEYLRPFVGVKPAGGHFLHFCAFELGRGPDGAWWVLGDRTQAPSGAGFALENRVATTRALSDIYGEMHVHRLAGFFRRFRDALIGMAGTRRPRRHPDARAAQRDLFRARLYRPLSRHHAARRRGPDGHRRQADGAHRLRA